MSHRPNAGIARGATRNLFIFWVIAAPCGLFRCALAETPEPPKSPDGSATVSLFAAEPDIVTPIGATVDASGRLLVIESNTHFRPKNYVGPASDRIRIIEDAHHSGKADRFTTFYEGETYMMNLVADRDGSVVASSRNEIFRLLDPDHRGVSSQKIVLAHLETKSNYPHNGLHGLTVDRNGNIYFGIGENLGGAYTLIGADDTRLGDDTGAGSVFRIDSKGHNLTRISRGFWNPFGLGADALGNIWTVDNDPDGRPPCRLIQIVPGGDFGYEFRYGRSGLHPLQAWDGELPGTLGMVSGVGEAPCAVQWQRNQLFVSSWRDHQVQAYTLIPHGASFTASMQPLLTGGDSFRPVGLAFAPDGSLYVTDWASSSYAVNHNGRVWKVMFTHPNPTESLKPSDAAVRAAHLRDSDNVAELTAALDDSDPATAQAAQFGLSRLPAIEKIEWKSLASPRQHIGLMAALLWRGSALGALVRPALADSDDRVRQMGVRAVAEQNITEARPELEQLLSSQSMSPRLLGMTIATINQLDGDKSARIDSGKINTVLLARMNAPQATDATKATALHMMQASHPHIPLEQVHGLLQSPALMLQLEAVRYLNADPDPARFALLAHVAADEKLEPDLRAEAVIGLSDDAEAQAELLLKLAADSHASVRGEALRSLRPIAAKLTEAQCRQLDPLSGKYPADADLVYRLLRKTTAARPPETDIAAWQKLLDQGQGDPEAGRRIFFHPAAAGCARCHMIEGRGRSIGPDLTMIGHSQTREHVLESILDPSREIAPLFTLWSITTRKGETIDAMLLRRDGQAMEVYVDSAGKEYRIPEKEIVDRRIRKESLMPTGLVQGLTDQELRDVVAYLTQKR